jgi:hypothetical protein
MKIIIFVYSTNSAEKDDRERMGINPHIKITAAISTSTGC